MNPFRSMIIAGGVMLLAFTACTFAGAAWLLQIPSGYLASFFLGAPASVEGGSVMIFAHPLLVVGPECSGIRFFSFIAGLCAGYWCGKTLWRWLALLPFAYSIALFSNAARISMTWQFRRFTDGLIPEWLQEYTHMGLGIVCFLFITAVFLHWILRHELSSKNTP